MSEAVPNLDDCREFVKQETLDRWTIASWVGNLARWEYMATLTFRPKPPFYHGMGESGAMRAYERFMKRHLNHASYFYALERNPSRDGYHVHALWADLPELYRKEPWAAWFQRHGRALIEPVRHRNAAEEYVSKYCTKQFDSGWWNVWLQWHRKAKLSGEQFQLRSESAASVGVPCSMGCNGPGGVAGRAAPSGPLSQL